MKIEKITEFNQELLESLNELLPQLSSSAPPLDKKRLIEIIDSNCCNTLIAIDNGQIYGMLTLVIFRIPTGVRSRIEDVVVSEQARGKGVGRLLTDKAIELAKQAGAKTIDLTSRPSREVANHLYQKAGFKKRESIVYRYNTK